MLSCGCHSAKAGLKGSLRRKIMNFIILRFWLCSLSLFDRADPDQKQHLLNVKNNSKRFEEHRKAFLALYSFDLASEKTSLFN